MAKVVRLLRKGGKIVQDCDVYIGRSVKRGGWNLEASIWANPFKRTPYVPGSTLAAYEKYVRSSTVLMNEIPSLVGKTLGCWCKPNPCHGDVLVKLVNEHLQTEDFEVLPGVGEQDSEQGDNE